MNTIRRVLPSVVLITTESGLGSGVVFDNSGHIVTNAHVVGTATTFQVSTANSSSTLTARLVGSYPPDDLAVIKVSRASGLRPANFGDSSALNVGDLVLAMGNPLGLSSSVTNGIVSAVGRTVSEPAEAGSPGATLRDVIQTSADINPGNSGGALVNLDGQVIGIPTLAATDQQLGGAAPGIGFAISSNVAKDIASQLIDHGKVIDSHRAALGVIVTTVADQNGEPVGAGIASLVSGGPASRAGLQAGDVITSVNNRPTLSAQDLGAVLATLKPGQTVAVQIERAGTDKTINVTLGSLPG
ncbi:MAG: S1C family serine protease [Dermatophilaceae bacterium]